MDTNCTNSIQNLEKSAICASHTNLLQKISCTNAKVHVKRQILAHTCQLETVNFNTH